METIKESKRELAKFLGALDGSWYYVTRDIYERYGYNENGQKKLDELYKKYLDETEKEIRII